MFTTHVKKVCNSPPLYPPAWGGHLLIPLLAGGLRGAPCLHFLFR